jgi:hypothetical protein
MAWREGSREWTAARDNGVTVPGSERLIETES